MRKKIGIRLSWAMLQLRIGRSLQKAQPLIQFRGTWVDSTNLDRLYVKGSSKPWPSAVKIERVNHQMHSHMVSLCFISDT